MRRLYRVLLSAGFLLAIGIFTWQHQAVFDWWLLRVYEPSREIAYLADRAAMSDTGRRFFYVSDPEINSKREFNENCPTVEKAFVLGCYARGRIFILEVEREELDGIMEVTAAHEMLHAAYDRLGSRERNRIIELLEANFAAVEDERLIRLIERYEESDDIGVRHDELHSILPMQVAELSPELERYFSRYFTDRSRVVNLYREYEATFERLHSRIDTLQTEIEQLKSQITQLENEIEAQQVLVADLNARLDRLERDGDISEFNALVPEQNTAVSSHNNSVDTYRLLINQHNRKVEQLNDIVLLQNDLVNSIDSTYRSL